MKNVRIIIKTLVERKYSGPLNVPLLNVHSDAEKAITRHDEWMQLREQAIANHNASGSTSALPRSITDDPPSRPEPFQDEEMTDVSVDMTANGFDASESFTLDRSIADEMVPVADPGLDRPSVRTKCFQEQWLMHSAYLARRVGHTRPILGKSFAHGTSYQKKICPTA